MNWTAEQDAALCAVRRWLDDPGQQVFRLFGAAGTGKTTLAREFGADLYAAYTGKAAYVLRGKGCPGATTIHSLIYLPKQKSAERLKRLEAERKRLAQLDGTQRELEELARAIGEEQANYRKPAFTLNLDSPLKRAALLVVDEVSMVDERIAADLLSFGCKVLALGDPYQLPPVYGDGYFTAARPDFLLREVHRQARESPVLDFATIVREEQRYPRGHVCLRPAPVDVDDVMAADQLIVGRNRTRHYWNSTVRAALGRHNPLPGPGDKLVCTRNNHELGLLNGAVYDVHAVMEYWDEGRADSLLSLELSDNTACTAHAGPFRGEEVPWWAEREAERFEYGYALTCHKAQGSQWDKVLVVDEGRVFGADRWRWLYTAATRAVRELAVCV
jgi:Mesyanzhinovviridae Dda-like helicase